MAKEIVTPFPNLDGKKGYVPSPPPQPIPAGPGTSGIPSSPPPPPPSKGKE